MQRWSGHSFPMASRQSTKSPIRMSDVKTFYDIDTPITMAGLRADGRTDYLEARQISLFDVYFSFTGGPILRELETHSERAVRSRCIVRSIRNSIAASE